MGLLLLSIITLMQDATTLSGGTWFQLKDGERGALLRLENNGVYFLRPAQKFNLLVGTRQSRARLPYVNIGFPEHWMAAGGTIAATAERSFDCVAPAEAGSFEIVVDYELAGIEGQDRLLLVVMSASRDVFNSYPRTYSYPDSRSRKAPAWVRKNASRYRPPSHMFAVTPDLLQREIVPGYRLDNFICPSSPGETTRVPFAALSAELMEKLRVISLSLIKNGVIARKVSVLEGYRSPRYNASLAGAQPFSRHLYGDAMTFIVDEDSDGRMDDLNRDGVINRDDAVVVARIIRDLESRGEIPKGGTGINEYSVEGMVARVEIQIDCRGYASVWGVSVGGAKKESFNWWK